MSLALCPGNLHQHHVAVDGYSSVNYSFAAQSISQSREGFLQYTGYATAHGKFALDVLSLEGY